MNAALKVLGIERLSIGQALAHTFNATTTWVRYPAGYTIAKDANGLPVAGHGYGVCFADSNEAIEVYDTRGEDIAHLARVSPDYKI